jgi:hypothetical protein
MVVRRPFPSLGAMSGSRLAAEHRLGVVREAPQVVWFDVTRVVSGSCEREVQEAYQVPVRLVGEGSSGSCS